MTSFLSESEARSTISFRLPLQRGFKNKKRKFFENVDKIEKKRSLLKFSGGGPWETGHPAEHENKCDPSKKERKRKMRALLTRMAEKINHCFAMIAASRFDEQKRRLLHNY